MAINSCVETALDVLESIHHESDWELSLLTDLKVPLRFLKTFYLCGKSWGEGERCETILLLIEQTVHKYEKKFQSTGLRFDDHLQEMVSEFLVCIQHSFLREMEDLYTILLDSSLLADPPSPQEVHSLVDIIDSLLHNLEDLRLHSNFGTNSSRPIQDLENYVRFLKNLINFSITLGLEHMQMKDPLTCIVGLVLNAARLTFMSWYSHHRKMWYIIYQLVEGIKPVESKVRGMYIKDLQEALNLSSSSHHLNRPIHRLRLIEFVDSLLFLLSQLLFFGSSYGDIFKPKMQKISLELTSLKTFLREHHYEKLHDHMIRKAGIVICEVGIVICYLFPKKKEGLTAEELEHLILNLENRFILLKTVEEDAEKYLLKPASFYPQTNLLGFIDFVLEKIKSLGDALAEDKRQSLYDDLSVLRSFLVDVQHGQNENLQALRSRITAVAYETEFCLDSLVDGDAIQSSVTLLSTVTEEMKLIRSVTDERKRIKTHVVPEAFQSKDRITRIQNIDTTYNKKRSAGEIPVVRLDDDAQKIIDQLRGGRKQLDIVAIVGEPGLGKTTMAKEVYNNPSIIYYFYVRSWCSLSQVYNKKHLLIEIMSGLPDCLAYGSQDEDEEYLGLKLCSYLKRKRYLIVLDDIWNIETWDYLKKFLPDDRVGSRILLTSQCYDVALYIKPYGRPHSLRLLNEVESWELFQQKLNFEPGRTLNEEPYEHARKIVKLCKGLPLKILLVAELLSQEKGKPINWEEVYETVKRSALLRKTIELSYFRLPEYLKPCFLYFGAFKEDQEIHVQELLWLWMVEGFVEKDNAEEYLKTLIGRSLVNVAKKTFRGSAKSCTLDDHIFDFCRAKCKEERFLHFLDTEKFEISFDPSSSYRLCVYSSGEEEGSANSRLICPRLHSLIASDYASRTGKHDFNSLNNLFQSRLLRVLVLNDVPEFLRFPSGMPPLVHLKYLAIRTGDDDFKIPPSLSNLSNLETFIVTGYGNVYLPETLGSMTKLKHLSTRGGAQWVLPSENLKNLSNLENLHQLSVVWISDLQKIREVIRNFANIRTLKCCLMLTDRPHVDLEIASLDCLSHLRIVGDSYLHYSIRFRSLRFSSIQFPQNLKSLSLIRLELPWSEMSTIYRLRNLEVLKLKENAFIGKDWDMTEEEEEDIFPKLRFLKLEGLGLRNWTASDDCFLSLQKLVLSNCHQLEKLPSCLAYIPTLERIEVNSCEYVTDSIKQIQEEQMDFGNEDLKILISPADKRKS